MADELSIQNFLLEINSLHHTFNEENPITYQVLLAEFGEQLNEEQRQWCRNEMRRLSIKQNAINKKMLEYMDNEISRLPISEKINESENKCIQLKGTDRSLLNPYSEGGVQEEPLVPFNDSVYRLPVGKI